MLLCNILDILAAVLFRFSPECGQFQIQANQDVSKGWAPGELDMILPTLACLSI